MNELASDSSIQNLINTFNKDFECHGESMTTALSLWKVAEDISNQISSDTFDRIKAVSLVTMTYSAAQLELSALLKANFSNRNEDLLRRTLLLQVNRVIVESSKALFGFGKSDVRRSFWDSLESCCDLSLWKDEVQIMKTDFNNLSEVANGYISKESRDIASHYDLDPLLIEAEYEKLYDEDKVVRNACAYLKVIEKMASVIKRAVLLDEKEFCVQTYNRVYQPPIQSLTWEYESLVLMPEMSAGILYSYNTNLAHLSKLLGHLHYKKRLLSTVVERGLPVNINSPELVFYDYVLRFSCLIAYMQNDVIASVYSASTSSNSYECYIHLKRVYVSVYEALNKICGLTEKSRKDSLLSYLNSELKLISPKIVKEYESLKLEIMGYIDGAGANYSNESIRNSFAHYRNGKTTYVVDGCNNLLNLHLIQEIGSIIPLIKILNKLLVFLYHISNEYKRFSDIQYEKKMDEVFKNIRSTLDNSNASPEVRAPIEKEMEKIAGIMNNTIDRNKKN